MSIPGTDVTCDDCRKTYPGPPYYTFETEGCNEAEEINGVWTPVAHDCTENICPQCAGPFMEGDMENDPRRPAVDFYDERIHANLIDAENYRKHGDQIPIV